MTGSYFRENIPEVSGNTTSIGFIYSLLFCVSGNGTWDVGDIQYRREMEKKNEK